MKKVEVQHSSRTGAINVPIDGEIELDENGVGEVSEECAELLTTKGKGWSYPGELDDLSDDAIAEFLEGLELSDLKKLALQNKVHKHEEGKDEWGEANKEKETLIAYIVKFMNDGLKGAINNAIEEE